MCSKSKILLSPEEARSLYSNATSPISSSGQSQPNLIWKVTMIHGSPDSLVVSTIVLVGKMEMKGLSDQKVSFRPEYEIR